MLKSFWQTLKCQIQNFKNLILLTINIQASLSLHFCVCCLWKFVGKVSGNSSIRVCRVSAASTDQSEARICVDQWESWRWLGHHSGPVTVSSELFYSREGFSSGPASPINQYWEGQCLQKSASDCCRQSLDVKLQLLRCYQFNLLLPTKLWWSAIKVNQRSERGEGASAEFHLPQTLFSSTSVSL